MKYYILLIPPEVLIHGDPLRTTLFFQNNMHASTTSILDAREFNSKEEASLRMDGHWITRDKIWEYHIIDEEEAMIRYLMNQ